MKWAEFVLVRDFIGPSCLVRVVFGPSCPALNQNQNSLQVQRQNDNIPSGALGRED